MKINGQSFSIQANCDSEYIPTHGRIQRGAIAHWKTEKQFFFTNERIYSYISFFMSHSRETNAMVEFFSSVSSAKTGHK